MNLKYLTDDQLNLDLKCLVQNERELLTQILYHLKEIEARKLFTHFGCSSLFDYSCKELKYSSDQAFRRIQAMRLLKDIPEAAQKIDSGELSLSNITQAQKFFKETKTTNKSEKISVLRKLMNKSVREGQKELLKLHEAFNPDLSINIQNNLMQNQELSKQYQNTTTKTGLISLPPETKKQVSSTHVHVSFNMSEDLEKKLEHIKSLLGPKLFKNGLPLTMAELIEMMADLSREKLMEKKFGQRIVTQDQNLNPLKTTLNVQSRYVSKTLRYKLWKQADGKCENCQSQHNLNIDHIQPFALNGQTTENNLRVLCFSCNQRSRITAGL